jgi:hypothetical protein
MTDDLNTKEKSKSIIDMGTFNFSNKSLGTYLFGVVKLYKDEKRDMLDSAESFLKAA